MSGAKPSRRSLVAAVAAMLMVLSACAGSTGNDDNVVMAPATDGAAHQAAMALVSAQPTHRAVATGRWSDPATWQNRQVPGAGARVLIPEGVRVDHNTFSGARLQTVRVDGHLNFPSWAYSEMTVDTIVVTGSGRLTMGSKDRPVERGVHITFANNGDIDTGRDPKLLSRGLISMGSVEIFGTKKTTFLQVARDPRAGDTVLELAEAPVGWAAGDQIVLTGTRKRGHGLTGVSGWSDTEDEVLTVSSVSGNRVTVDRPLRFDHTTPAADLKAYVANLTRTISFSSENGASTPPHQRGHVMLMSHDSEVRYAAFEHLGRTDKSRQSLPDTMFNPVRFDSNVQGRYPLHLHQTGVEADKMDNPVPLVGNAVNGSPGWGIVQHSAHSLFAQNASFDVFGAHYVSEGRNDSGAWASNIAIKAEGRGGGMPRRTDVHDIGVHGAGFHFNNRTVRAVDNVAANTHNGFVYWAGAPADRVSPGPGFHQLEQPELGYGAPEINPLLPRLTSFRDNEVFGANMALGVERNNSQQNSDLRSHFENFTAWEVRTGIYSRYSPHYTMENLRLRGTDVSHGNGERGYGIAFDRKSFDQVIIGATIENFEQGMKLWGQQMRDLDRRHGVTFVDVTMRNVATQYESLDAGHRFMSRSQMKPGQLAVRYKRLDPIHPRQSGLHDWIKADSIGYTSRQWDYDRQEYAWKYQMQYAMREYGYHRLANGDKVFLWEDFVGDRGSDEFIKLITPIPVAMTDAELQAAGAKDNGLITLGGPAPSVTSERVEVDVDGEGIIDVLANDTDPDGGRIWVDGFKHPDHGMVSVTDGGLVRYVPFPAYEGTDQFSYWVRDEEGNISRGEVAVRVGAGALPSPSFFRPTDPGNLDDFVARNWKPVGWQLRTGGNYAGQNFDLLSQDYDPDGDELFLTELRVASGDGSFDIRLNDEDRLTVRPRRDTKAGSSYVYEFSDGHGNVDDAFIVMTHRDGPDAPLGIDLAPKYPDGTGAGYDSSVDAWVVDATAERRIGDLFDMQQIDSRTLGARGLWFGADSANWDVGSVVFMIDGQQNAVDNDVPFESTPRALPDGTHVIRIQGFTDDNGTGNLLFEKRARITVGPSSVQPRSNAPRQLDVVQEVVDGGIYMIRLKAGDGKCLDEPPGPNANGIEPHIWTCSGGNTRQHWRFESAGDGSYRIVNVFSGRLLNLDDPADQNGSTVRMWSDLGLSRQRWYPERSSRDEAFELRAASGSWKTLTTRGSTQGAKLEGWGVDPTGNGQDGVQHWYLQAINEPANPAPPPQPGPNPAPQPNPNPQPGGEVTFYLHGGFNGRSWTVGPGVYDQAVIGASPVGDNSISSAQIPDGMSIRVCESAGGSGRCETHDAAVPFFATMNDQISFFEVRAGGGGNPPQPTPGPEPLPSGVVDGGVYLIRSVASDRCVDLPPPANANGIEVHLWDCSPTLNRQQWRFEADGADNFRIVNVASGKILNLDTPADTNGKRIQVWDDLRLTRQRWRPEDAGGGRFLLWAGSGAWKVVTADGTDNGAKLSGWNIDPGGGGRGGRQFWELQAISGSANPPPPQPAPVPTQRAVLYRDGGFGGASWSVDAGVYDYPAISASSVGNDAISSIRLPDGWSIRACQHGGGGGACETHTSSVPQLAGLDNQISFFEVRASGRGGGNPPPPPQPDPDPEPHPSGIVDGGVYLIRSVASDRCVDLPPPANANGIEVHLWDCSPTLNRQQWRFEATDADNFRIVNVASGKILNLDAPPDANSARIGVWDDLRLTRQRWRPEDAGGGRFLLWAGSGAWKVVTADGTDNGAKLSGWNVDPRGGGRGGRQFWELQPVGAGA